MKGLTPSQVRNAVGVAVGTIFAATDLIAEYAPAVQHMFPDIKQIAPVVLFAAMLHSALSRALSSKNSGTGTGLVDTGPDTRAAAANQSLTPPDSTVPAAPTAATAGVTLPGGSPLNESEQALIQVGLELVADLRQKATDDAVRQIREATRGMSVSALADGHRAIDDAKASAPSDSPSFASGGPGDAISGPGAAVTPPAPIAPADAIVLTGGNQ